MKNNKIPGIRQQFIFSRDFVVFPVSRHFPYSGDFVVSPISIHFWTFDVGSGPLRAEGHRLEARRETFTHKNFTLLYNPPRPSRPKADLGLAKDTSQGLRNCPYWAKKGSDWKNALMAWLVLVEFGWCWLVLVGVGWFWLVLVARKIARNRMEKIERRKIAAPPEGQ